MYTETNQPTMAGRSRRRWAKFNKKLHLKRLAEIEEAEERRLAHTITTEPEPETSTTITDTFEECPFYDEVSHLNSNVDQYQAASCWNCGIAHMWTEESQQRRYDQGLKSHITTSL